MNLCTNSNYYCGEYWKCDVIIVTGVTLCVSADMLVTPGTVKSNGSSGNPAFFIKGTRNPPRQLSTCTGMLYRFPNCK